MSASYNGSFTRPKSNFTQISNHVLRDNTLSLRAKGLFSLIYSYITLPNFVLYKDFLKSKCTEGRCAFDSAWKELTSSGYLKHSRTREENGTFLYQYELMLPDGEKLKITEQHEQSEQTSRQNLNIASDDSSADNIESIGSVHPAHSTHKGHIRHSEHKGRSLCTQSDLVSKGAVQSGHKGHLGLIAHSEHTECAVNTLPAEHPKTLLPVLLKSEYSSKNNRPANIPLAENQQPVYYIYNNTLSNKTQSVIDPIRLDYYKQKIEYDYFMSQDYSNEDKIIVSTILEYMPVLEEDSTLFSVIDSCLIDEFLGHVKTTATGKIRFPIPYWRKAFVNYIRELALLSVAI